MTATLRLAAVQQNYILGDIPGNQRRIEQSYRRAAEAGAELVVFSELAVTGYPPEDLVFIRHFQQLAMQAVRELAALTATGPAMLLGGIWVEQGRLTNSAFLLADGAVLHRFDKVRLAMGGVFDEKRTFHAAEQVGVAEWRGIRLGCLICQDIWHAEQAARLRELGAELILSPNASPYDTQKEADRRRVLAEASAASVLPIVYVNQLAGMDEIVFDGGSRVLSASGEVMARAPHWEEHLLLTDWRKETGGWRCLPQALPECLPQDADMYAAATLGLRDYLHKHGWQQVVLGLSGGVDSALVAAMAVDALGAEAVTAIRLPSRYTSEASMRDAEACAKRLGIRLETLPIEPIVQGAAASVSAILPDGVKDLTAQNLQSRARGLALMAYSNQTGALLLSTGNKSENAVGYCTLYGDMCGAYNPLKDLYKTQVYRLCDWRNGAKLHWMAGPEGAVIPDPILLKAPTAELKPNQTDQDSLPPYPLLDWMLQQLVEAQKSVAELLDDAEKPAAVTAEMVENVAKMLYAAEYKRRQAAPGPKISPLAFARDRRYPLTNGYVAGV